MFLPFELALKAALADAVPGAPIYGTFDEPDFEQHALVVQVAWQGYRVSAQSAARTEAAVDQRFVVRIGAGAGAIDAVQVERATTGLAELLRRVLAFRYGTGPGRVRPVLDSPPPPAYQGAAVELAIHFTLPGVATAAPNA